MPSYSPPNTHYYRTCFGACQAYFSHFSAKTGKNLPAGYQKNPLLKAENQKKANPAPLPALGVFFPPLSWG
jgi:hypothetical protein